MRVITAVHLSTPGMADVRGKHYSSDGHFEGNWYNAVRYCTLRDHTHATLMGGGAPFDAEGSVEVVAFLRDALPPVPDRHAFESI